MPALAGETHVRRKMNKGDWPWNELGLLTESEGGVSRCWVGVTRDSWGLL